MIYVHVSAEEPTRTPAKHQQRFVPTGASDKLILVNPILVGSKVGSRTEKKV